MVKEQLAKNFNSPLTSSCGRLFDAVSSILQICHTSSYEGEAAIRLESTAMEYVSKAEPLRLSSGFEPYSYALDQKAGVTVIDASPIVEQALHDKITGHEAGEIAARYHRTIADIILNVCAKLREDTGVTNICLSGGVFQNVLLLREVIPMLRSCGFLVFFPRCLPANDGGLSLGQAVAALATVQAL